MLPTKCMFTSDILRTLAYKANIIPHIYIQDFYINMRVSKRVIDALHNSKKYDKIKLEENAIVFYTNKKHFYYTVYPYFIKLLKMCITDPMKYLKHEFIKRIHIEHIRLKMEDAEYTEEPIGIKCAEFILS